MKPNYRGFEDIAVGRILFRDKGEAKKMIDKIEAIYNPKSFGRWRNNMLFVADDVDLAGKRLYKRI